MELCKRDVHHWHRREAELSKKDSTYLAQCCRCAKELRTTVDSGITAEGPCAEAGR